MRSAIGSTRLQHQANAQRPPAARLSRAVHNSLRTATYAFGLGLIAGMFWQISGGTLRPVFAFICMMNLGASVLMVLAVLAALRTVRRRAAPRGPHL